MVRNICWKGLNIVYHFCYEMRTYFIDRLIENYLMQIISRNIISYRESSSKNLTDQFKIHEKSQTKSMGFVGQNWWSTNMSVFLASLLICLRFSLLWHHNVNQCTARGEVFHELDMFMFLNATTRIYAWGRHLGKQVYFYRWKNGFWDLHWRQLHFS